MNFKKWIKNHLPKKDSFETTHPFLKKHVLKAELWHLNRRTVAKGTSVGLFIAFLPLPLQMLAAVLFAIPLKANIPIAVMMTWVTNPFTFIPINLFIFKIGEWISGIDEVAPLIQDFSLKDLSLARLPETFIHWMLGLGKPFLIGLPVTASFAALLGYFVVSWLWRLSVYFRWKKRIRHKSKKWLPELDSNQRPND